MKRIRSIASIADILIVVVLILLAPVIKPKSLPTGIPDKVEVRYYQALSPDSLQKALHAVKDEMEEMRYYLRIHNVNDDGFNLVARYNTQLQNEYSRLVGMDSGFVKPKTLFRRIKAKDRPMVAVKTLGGYWRAGHFHVGRLNGKGITRDYKGRMISALWNNDTIVTATRIDDRGIYHGQMDTSYMACGEGIMDEWDGCHKEGFWKDDQLHGFGFDSSPLHQLRIGAWKNGRFLGEELHYTTERIYGIDISRHQHEKGRHRFRIDWRKLRITSLGRRHHTEGLTFPVSFVYIKSTEGTTIRNRYFVYDYNKAHAQKLSVGAYHFFSLKSSAAEQANYFLKNTIIRPADFPPVLDVEPSDAQIRQIGGDDELMNRIRTFMQIVEKRTGKRPILYVNQMFINNHMTNAADIKQRYHVWIARYSQYKPDVKLIYWQLCPDGRVNGINGDVDINVFNGYQGEYEEFKRNVSTSNKP